METATASTSELIDELDGQLAEALRLAATRAEHVRLERLRATAARLRAICA